MKSTPKQRKPGLPVMAGGLVFLLGIMSTLGSGGGGNHNGGSASGDTPSGVTAFNFDAGNTLAAARSAASAMAFFPDFTSMARQILATLAASSPDNSPFDLAMCANAGHAMLTWIDADHNGDLSMGDSAALLLTNCDMDRSGAATTGTVKLGVTSAAATPPSTSVGVNASMNLTVNKAPDTTLITGSFKATSNTTNNADFTYVYATSRSTSQKLTATKNGGALYELGCFNVTETFNIADGAGTFKLASSGVVNAAESLMNLAGGGQLAFISNRLESGGQHLLSSPTPACAAVGAPGGAGGADGSHINMEALGGGHLRLHTFDGSNLEVNTTDTTWDALLN
jgi:hypothetical protein